MNLVRAPSAPEPKAARPAQAGAPVPAGSRLQSDGAATPTQSCPRGPPPPSVPASRPRRLPPDQARTHSSRCSPRPGSSPSTSAPSDAGQAGPRGSIQPAARPSRPGDRRTRPSSRTGPEPARHGPHRTLHPPTRREQHGARASPDGPPLFRVKRSGTAERTGDFILAGRAARASTPAGGTAPSPCLNASPRPPAGLAAWAAVLGAPAGAGMAAAPGGQGPGELPPHLGPDTHAVCAAVRLVDDGGEGFQGMFSAQLGEGREGRAGGRGLAGVGERG